MNSTRNGAGNYNRAKSPDSNQAWAFGLEKERKPRQVSAKRMAADQARREAAAAARDVQVAKLEAEIAIIRQCYQASREADGIVKLSRPDMPADSATVVRMETVDGLIKALAYLSPACTVSVDAMQEYARRRFEAAQQVLSQKQVSAGKGS